MPSLNTGNAILSNPIKVDSSYNVGIGGAASGSFKLQVTGTGNFTSRLTIGDAVGSSPLVWARSGGATGYLYSDGDNVGITNVLDFGAGYEGILLNSSDSAINFYTNGVSIPRMTITSAGNVGVGTATPSAVKPTTTFGWASNLPSRAIEIAPAGSAASGANAGLFLRSSDAANGFDLWADNFFGDAYLDVRGDAGFIFRARTNGTAVERMRITSSGNVGIGSDSITNGTAFGGGGQVNRLKVQSSNYTCLEINGNTSGGSIQFTYGSNAPNQVAALMAYNYANGAANEFVISNVLGGPMILATANTERLRITSGGNVLIGTTSDNSFNFVAGGDGKHSYLGNTMQISASDFGGTERQGAFGVAEWANQQSPVINLASIFPRITFSSRALSVLVQIGTSNNSTSQCSALVLFSRTINSGWSSTVIANINNGGTVLNSVSGSGTSITLNFNNFNFGSAMITILNRA